MPETVADYIMSATEHAPDGGGPACRNSYSRCRNRASAPGTARIPIG